MIIISTFLLLSNKILLITIRCDEKTLSIGFLFLDSMVLRAINSLLNVLTRPYFYLQQHALATMQSSLPDSFDDKTWLLIFVVIALLTVLIAFVLSRFVTLRDADEDPVYQRSRFYSAHRKTS